jgi:hypothetical protein
MELYGLHWTTSARSGRGTTGRANAGAGHRWPGRCRGGKLHLECRLYLDAGEGRADAGHGRRLSGTSTFCPLKENKEEDHRLRSVHWQPPAIGRPSNTKRGDNPTMESMGTARPRRAPGWPGHGELRDGPATASSRMARPRRAPGRSGHGELGRCFF